MKKIFLLLFAIMSFSAANSQGTDWVKLGVHVGSPVEDASETSSVVLGVDLKYQFLNRSSYAVGISTGYSNYFGKDSNDDFAIIPLAALFRYYPTKRFFMGADLGYGFATENDDKGFYYRPEIGYHNDEWNIFAFYQGIALDSFTPASVGIGVSYNIVGVK